MKSLVFIFLLLAGMNVYAADCPSVDGIKKPDDGLISEKWRRELPSDCGLKFKSSGLADIYKTYGNPDRSEQYEPQINPAVDEKDGYVKLSGKRMVVYFDKDGITRVFELATSWRDSGLLMDAYVKNEANYSVKK